ncbi:MAG TPA: DUF4160 domain-containing protein [bacterium]|jgi:hypothetical protein|nr:DUF4160 domain-containing protein [bacterium]HOB72019.1 DUF4160 domain-containing protein [bacterium]HOG44452.1 DUF4160 domain-containing protein [bacterium]HPG37068.1 DUF4160 domain-containing protein [bacterium]HPY15568.1 DUF4160 domain-containing protein [bacterium]
MPEISRFLGIVVFMNFKDHNPPHFHAMYGDYQIIVEINTGVVEGKFPKRALSLLMEWYEIHREELLKNWETLKNKGSYEKITPLE